MTSGPRFKFAHSGAARAAEACRECLERLGDVDREYNLGFLYLTDTFPAHPRDVVALLRRTTGIGDWVGGVGFGVCATGEEYYDRPGMAVLAARFPAGSFRVVDDVSASLEGIREAHAQDPARARPVFGIVHGNPADPETPDLVLRLARATSGFLVGGLTSSRVASGQIANLLTRGGLSGVLIDGDVPLVTGLTQGYSPIGPTRTITACQDNLLVGIDGRPALAVFVEEAGEQFAGDLRRAAGLVQVALVVEGSDTGDYLVRNIVAVDPGNEVFAIGERVEEGGRIMFCRRDPEAAERDLRRMLRSLRARGGEKAKGGIYVSCVARGPNLFGPRSGEMRTIAEEIGDLPLVGFFGNGEISNDRLYGYTGVLTLFL